MELDPLRFKYLQYLDLGRNEITNVDGILEDCPLLGSLILHSNKLSAFPVLKNVLLKELWLNSNQIK